MSGGPDYHSKTDESGLKLGVSATGKDTGNHKKKKRKDTVIATQHRKRRRQQKGTGRLIIGGNGMVMVWQMAYLEED